MAIIYSRLSHLLVRQWFGWNGLCILRVKIQAILDPASLITTAITAVVVVVAHLLMASSSSSTWLVHHV